ncbi:MAG: class I SAM-dependent methyltransferase [Marmoricola sp.]
MTDVGDAYARSAALWRSGAEPVYARMADALLGVSPIELTGAAVLDVGAGTGVAARAALARGADRAVALDLADAMLRLVGADVQPVVADIGRTPFGDGAFDLVVAAFCLGHVPDPSAAVRELRRVGGALVVSAFAPGPAHPAKAVVDAVLGDVGFRTPPWYQHLKSVLEPQVDDPESLATLVRAGGFDDVRVQLIDVDAGLASAEAVVDWRFGMAHLAPFVAGLDPETRERARAAAVRAVTGMQPVVVRVLALSAT